MAEISLKYMTVTVDHNEDGLNLSCWFSTVEFWMSEVSQFPHQYTHMGDSCTWILHSNSELTNKAIAYITEYADHICHEQQVRNERRQIANRRH